VAYFFAGPCVKVGGVGGISLVVRLAPRMRTPVVLAGTRGGSGSRLLLAYAAPSSITRRTTTHGYPRGADARLLHGRPRGFAGQRPRGAVVDRESDHDGRLIARRAASPRPVRTRRRSSPSSR
jgi:hypothetical protein